ncbi:hypothetical protein CHU95_03815 [Niveispirillum lacus]|uniref:Uncharacterized protein n=1 Tax=Niveispirillum lacus TaxID=1981099 RepID=A0A255Z5D8_9PROT|nr:hypothetical protein [Niveispirillum lacus]OYQ36698.1 hypothetical protein CHU95_03815 [Niveispirillum lacus]
MPIENTDLERRVLAHERILQVLIAHMAETEPKFLDRLQKRFTKGYDLGAFEHDFVGTDQHAWQFIRRVMEIGVDKE